MSTRLAVRFPLGRYHAAAWGTHPNEGTVEWPPSPWRLLRALYATWRERADDLDANVVRRLFGRLAEPPAYWLPPAGRGHSRHYYPDADFGPVSVDGKGQVKPKGGTDLAVDAFVTLDPTMPVVVDWDVELADDERAALATLASRLSYLGRAESVCAAELVDEVPPGLAPTCPQEGLSVQTPAIRLLAVDRPDDETLSQMPPRLRRQGRAAPLGTRWVTYPVPASSEPLILSGRARSRAEVTTLRWAIHSRPRPSILAAVAVGHVFRRAVLEVLRRGGAEVPTSLLGRADGGGLLAGHRHAHFISVDLDGDGLVEAVVLWVPDGLPSGIADRLASSLSGLRGHEHIPDFRPCRLGFEAFGTAELAAPTLVGPARRWRTVTPFAPRFAETSRNRRGGDRWAAVVERQIRKELALRGLPEPESVRLVRGRFHALDFRRHRPDRQRLADAYRAAHAEVAFPDLVTGPVLLGALSHFGLGLFQPTR